jgi:hypothetical protein
MGSVQNSDICTRVPMSQPLDNTLRCMPNKRQRVTNEILKLEISLLS